MPPTVLKVHNTWLLAYSVALLVVGAAFAMLDLAGGIVHHLMKYQVHARWSVAGSVLLYVFIMFVASGPRRAEVIAVVAMTAVEATVHFTLLPADQNGGLRQWYWFFVTAFWAGVSSIIVFAARLRKSNATHSKRSAVTLLVAGIFVLVFGLSGNTMLDATVSLHPRTFDQIAYVIDGGLGFQPSVVFALLLSSSEILREASVTAYRYMPFLFAVLFGMQLQCTRQLPVNALMAWMVGALIAYPIYHLCPVSGPAYAFRELFPLEMPDFRQLEAIATMVSPSPRNGVPSMHFAWSLLLWLNARYLGVAWFRALCAINLGLNFIATLGLGEHYLIDLVVSVPFVLAVQAVCWSTASWKNLARIRAWVGGIALTIGWLLAIRFGGDAFKGVTGLTWVCMTGTMVIAYLLYRRLESQQGVMAETLRVAEPASDILAPSDQQRGLWIAVIAMFFVSGFAGLAYEVAFSKSLALTFGSMATATYTVLVIYMAGMAIGAWLGGIVGERYGKPLVLYAACELGIGIYAIVTPTIFAAAHHLYLMFGDGATPDSGFLQVARVVLGSAALLVPTVLMGMTLPILTKHLVGADRSIGHSVGALYGANTLGAALGALSAGYFILPFLGVYKTTMMVAVLSLIVALIALKLNTIPARAQPAQTPPSLQGQDAIEPITPKGLGAMALCVLVIVGTVTMMLEVNYMHLLAVVVGNSTYAFSLMLFAFLLGLGGGAVVGKKLLSTRIELPLALAYCLLSLAIVILFCGWAWNAVPEYFASFGEYPLFLGFAAREFVRGIICFLVMFPAAAMIGAAYPIAMELVGRASAGPKVLAMGKAAALNTTGNIVGILLAGFVLLPSIGALAGARLAAACAAVAAALAAAFVIRARAKHLSAILIVFFGCLALTPSVLDYTRLSNGANVYFASQERGVAIDHAESSDGGLTTVVRADGANGKPTLTLLTNGKFQGNDAVQGEMVAQAGFSLVPLVHTTRRDAALVIGYGTGMTANVFHKAGFSRMDIVELSGDMLRLADKHFASVNDGVSRAKGVEAYVTDGRNFLQLQNRSYDVISLEISSIWFAGAANLYNREFYQIAKRRLAPGGLLQQWVQLHHISPSDFLYVIGSVRSEFRYVWFYHVGGQGVILASNEAGSGPNDAAMSAIETKRELMPLKSVFPGGFEEIKGSLKLGPGDIDRMLTIGGVKAAHWISTDDNMILEYSTPRGNALPGEASYRGILNLIDKYSARATGVRP